MKWGAMISHIAGSQMWSFGFIRGYSLMIFTGFLVSVLTVMYFWKRYKYSWEILQILIIIVTPMSIFGAKFYTLLVDGKWHEWYILEGLSIYGGLIFSIIPGMIYIYFVRHAVDFRTVISIILPAILIGQSIGRWGNFFNHEVYGDTVSGDSLNWLPSWIKDNMYIKVGDQTPEYRQPIFLYESFFSFVGYFILVWVLNRLSIFKPGATSGLYLIWYGIERLILQTFRDPSQTSFIGNSGIPLNLVVSILAIFLGLGMFMSFQLLVKPFDKLSDKLLPDRIKQKITHEYEVITPVKPRRILFFGEKVEYKKKYLMFFGPEVPNIVKLHIRKRNNKKYSKRELNRGTNK